MKSTVNKLWNSLLTATVVAMLYGLFIAAMPPVYRATATVKGDADGMLIIQSGELLDDVLASSGIQTVDLQGWLEEFASADLDGTMLLRQKLFVASGAQDDWIDITVEAQVARTASHLANEIARAYLDRVRQNELTLEARAELFAGVKAAEFELTTFIDAHPAVLDFKVERKRLDRELAKLKQQHQIATQKHRQIVEKEALARLRDTENLQDRTVQKAAGAASTLQLRLAELATRYGSQHRKLIEAEAKLAESRKMLESALEEAVVRFNQLAQTVQHELKQIDRGIENLHADVERLSALEVTHRKLLLGRESALDRFDGMTREQKRYEFSEATPPDNSLGFNQLVLLGVIFAGVFVLVFLLSSIRNRVS
ncbi:MAG: hypothetical protein HOC70_11210 [Gammaproteobacteria bacterium]|jgi:hypothetical protein|nr:hypothetical protein [Gammaproteobacteria bacterium]MBT4493802.1 hypothetical protein [Gammaproteobacteria bacterium]MBT7369957.1 hypothetical protein [Gammaproteobacteria bacterium]